MAVRRHELFFLVGISITTIGFHLYDFGKPAIWADETSYFFEAVSLVHHPRSDLYRFSLHHGDRIGIFPIQHSPYVGALESYLVTPILYFFGLNVTAIRGYEMLTAISIVVLTYFLGKELFSRRIGMISSSLLSVLPMFVFYSRQSLTYEWSLISFALLIIIFGLRYLKTLKIRYLFGSLFLIGMGIWGYLWFLWFVLGLVATIPVVIKSMKFKLQPAVEELSRNGKFLRPIQLKHNKIKFIITVPISLLVGFTPIIISYFHNSSPSHLVPFLLRTISGEHTGYGAGSNTNIAGNIVERSHHLFDMLGHLNTGLWFSSAHYTQQNYMDNDTSYVLYFLFLAMIVVLLIQIFYNRRKSKRIIGLMLLIAVTLLSSSFTVSSFQPVQLGILLPFIFLVIGKGIDTIVSNKKLLNFFSFLGRKNSSNYVTLGIVSFLVITQIPILIKGYDIIENAPYSGAYATYEKLNLYLKENKLIPVTGSFNVVRGIVVYTNAEQIPIPVTVGDPGMKFDEKTKRTLPVLESKGLLNKKYLFIISVYPFEPPCSTLPVSHLYDMGHNCAWLYFVESAAIRNNKTLEKIDFPFPDGTPFLRTLRFVD
jgi:4-amino-4-deoxy-L-arabinose transferase-like glycosyltransferase